jgi:hypothetical protein
MRVYRLCLVLSAVSLFAGPALALECSSPRLKSASGVIGNQHSYKITGKYAQATNYYVGIDKLRLYPAGPIN